MKTVTFSTSPEIVCKPDMCDTFMSVRFARSGLTDAEKSQARDAALREIASILRKAGLLDLVIARETLSLYLTDAEMRGQAKAAKGLTPEEYALMDDSD